MGITCGVETWHNCLAFVLRISNQRSSLVTQQSAAALSGNLDANHGNLPVSAKSRRSIIAGYF